MNAKRLDPQTDLFDLLSPGAPRDPDDEAGRPMREQISPEELFTRQEAMFRTLDMVRAATVLPWPDLTRATVEEMSFHSMAQVWFEPEEALQIRRAFNVEMKRLWGAINDVSLYNEL